MPLNILSITLLAVLVVLIVYFISLFNTLIAVKNNVSKAWSNIDVLLKQRHDEIPKLVATCQQYMQYEQDTLKQVIEARNAAESARKDENTPELNHSEGMLSLSLGKLFALAEAYPDLKANHSFVQLQQRISGLEEQIADRRELYNESVTINNTRIQQFPGSIIATWFKFERYDVLSFSEDKIADVNMTQLFSNK